MDEWMFRVICICDQYYNSTKLKKKTFIDQGNI